MPRAAANHDTDQLDLFTVSMKQAVADAVSVAFDKKHTGTKHVADPQRDLAAYPVNMRVDQVASYLNCDEKHVRNLIEEGSLDAKDISTTESSRRCYRIPRASVAAYDQRTQEKAIKNL